MKSANEIVRKTAKPGRAVKPKGETAADGRNVSALTPSKREQGASERREAIVAAGLAEFTAKGFANTRLEDVAKRAGVAKGTIYLHFKDKEALFQELVRTALVPIAARLAGFALPDGISLKKTMETFAGMWASEVVGTPRGDIIRLVISEGARFPSLAEFYYREVVSIGIAGMRKLVEVAIARGEIKNTAFAEFPQLIVAPAMVAVVWQGLFGKFAPLDVDAMMRAHINLIFSEGRAA
jgi:AcrR family transcriptional regulator